MQGIITGETHVTCTACAGTLLLEFGTLSRLTGDPVYEAAARHALEQVYGVCPLITLYALSMTTYGWPDAVQLTVRAAQCKLIGCIFQSSHDNLMLLDVLWVFKEAHKLTIIS